MDSITTCRICVYKEGEDPRFCSVCLNHLCKGAENYRSVCSPCLMDCVRTGALQKDEKGRYIDPEKQTPLPTCKCGLPKYPFSPCMIALLNGSNDGTHEFIK